MVVSAIHEQMACQRAASSVTWFMFSRHLKLTRCGYFFNMEKTEYRAVIKHFNFKGFTPKQIKKWLDSVHGTSVPSFATVYSWVNEFKRGRISTKDEQRSGKPYDVTTTELLIRSAT